MKEKKKKQGLKATSLQKTLIAINVLIFVLSWGGFYLFQNWMKTTVADSPYRQQQNRLNETNQLKNDLNKYKDQIKTSESLVLNNATYKSKITGDLNVYAKQSGLSIGQITTTADPSNIISPMLIRNGISAKYLLISLNNPMKYTNLLKFISLIETSSPKIQIVNISIDNPVDSSANVNVKQLIIEVYTR